MTWATVVAFLALFLLIFELIWFGRHTIRNIDFDGISYLGIARHLRAGDFAASINAFRSPLFSWLIALCLPVGLDPVLTGKILTILSLVISAALLWSFTRDLWKSSLAASIAVFCFVAGRGVVALSTEFVTPDFLFSLLVLAYFMVLVRCMRNQSRRDWFLLGFIHALAFLTKAIALPWLAFTTLLAVLVLFRKRSREGIACLFLAAIVPIVVATAWATVLHSKYGVFSTGSQFKANLLQWTLHHPPDASNDSRFLRNTSRSLDADLVFDPMPPGANGWTYRLPQTTVARAIAAAEFRNLPAAMKELAIVVTPGGLLGCLIILWSLARAPRPKHEEFRLVLIIAAASGALLLAYCALTFDERYILPIVPPIIAVAAGVVADRAESLRISSAWRYTSILLALCGAAFTAMYPASPFRTLDRDFQAACYDAGNKLQSPPGETMLSLGAGPYPSHGVGWEAPFKSEFFGERRLVAYSDELPSTAHWPGVFAEISAFKPDAVLVWGNPHDTAYSFTVRGLNALQITSRATITDPAIGEVGTIIFLR